jgi:hypothetical protein
VPFDKKGGHHLNTQKAMASDKMAGAKSAPPPPAAAAASGGEPMDMAGVDDMAMQAPPVVCPHCGAEFIPDDQSMAPAGDMAQAAPPPAQHAQLSGM